LLPGESSPSPTVKSDRRHNVDIDPDKTTHDLLEFAFAEIARFGNVQASTTSPEIGKLFDWLRSRHLSKMRH
jgi:hypothetical protein